MHRWAHTRRHAGGGAARGDTHAGLEPDGAGVAAQAATDLGVLTEQAPQPAEIDVHDPRRGVLQPR